MDLAPQLLKRRWRQTLHWSKGILRDGTLAGIEAFIVLVISNLAWILLSIKYALENPGVDLPQAITKMFDSLFEPTEVMIYVSAILSPTIAYFVMRLGLLSRRGTHMLLVLPVACLLIWIATPLYFSGLDGSPVNREFALDLAVGLGTSALVLWYLALFAQRRLFERELTYRGDRRGVEVAKNVEGS